MVSRISIKDYVLCLQTTFQSHLPQLSYHSTLSKAFHSSLGRSSTPRLLLSLLSPGCPCTNQQVDGK